MLLKLSLAGSNTCYETLCVFALLVKIDGDRDRCSLVKFASHVARVGEIVTYVQIYEPHDSGLVPGSDRDLLDV